MPAIAAIIIEEFDDRDVALRVADRQVILRIEDRRLVVSNHGVGFDEASLLLLLLQRILNIEHDLWIFDQVLLDELAELLLLRVVECCRRIGSCHRGSERERGEDFRKYGHYIL